MELLSSYIICEYRVYGLLLSYIICEYSLWATDLIRCGGWGWGVGARGWSSCSKFNEVVS